MEAVVPMKPDIVPAPRSDIRVRRIFGPQPIIATEIKTIAPTIKVIDFVGSTERVAAPSNAPGIRPMTAQATP